MRAKTILSYKSERSNRYVYNVIRFVSSRLGKSNTIEYVNVHKVNIGYDDNGKKIRKIRSLDRNFVAFRTRKIYPTGIGNKRSFDFFKKKLFELILRDNNRITTKICRRQYGFLHRRRFGDSEGLEKCTCGGKIFPYFLAESIGIHVKTFDL